MEEQTAMKKQISKDRITLFIMIISIVSIIALISYQVSDNIKKEKEQQKAKEIKPVHMLYDESFYNKSPMVEKKARFTENERYLLAKIAMAEAEGESTEGKALVMQVVLNRVADDGFPDTIGEVIFEHCGDVYQFSSVHDGRIYRNEPNDDCWKALELIESGWDESDGALYFEATTSRNTWHNSNLELVLTEGGHQFYK